MRKKQLALVETINNYFGVDAAYFDVDAFTLAKQIMEDGWTKPVRCKNCKYFVQNEPYDPCECMKWTVKWGVAYVNPDDFCSYGERREGE